MSLPSDQVIADRYCIFDVPSDTLVRSSNYLREFIQSLPHEFHSVDLEKLAHRIITLRKKGRLPRLRRKAKPQP